MDIICPLPKSWNGLTPIELGTHPQWDGRRRINPLFEVARWYDPTNLVCILNLTFITLTGAI